MSATDYDTLVECEAAKGVWSTSPAPLCYLPANDLPVERIEIVQPNNPSNDIYYEKLQNLCMTSVKVMAPVYLVVWGVGVFRRLILARL
jgi:hypothetical protein